MTGGPRASTYEDILLITGGLFPALVTETLYALARRAELGGPNQFRPRRVIVACTGNSQRGFEAGGGLAARIQALYVDQDLGEPPLLELRAIASDDVRTAAHAEAFGDMVAGLVRDITADDRSRLHLSLAGGRKTMSFHAGAAIAIYGRPHDQLSHVLIDPPEAEGATNFLWPTKGSLPLLDKTGAPILGPGGPLDAHDVKIDLAEIPFLRVRKRLPKELLGRALSYGEIVRFTELAMDRQSRTLTLYVAKRQILVPGAAPVQLAARDFALYWALAERARDNIKGAGPYGIGGNHTGWLSMTMLSEPESDPTGAVHTCWTHYLSLRGGSGETTVKPPFHLRVTIPVPVDEDAKGRQERTAREAERRAANKAHFGECRSRIAKAFKAFPDPEIGAFLLATLEDDTLGVHFGIDVPAENIAIVD